MPSHPFMQYTPDEDEIWRGPTFRWHGGEYIDIGTTTADGEEFEAYDVINVWDHAEGKPRIPRTLDAFQARCDEYVADTALEQS